MLNVVTMSAIEENEKNCFQKMYFLKGVSLQIILSLIASLSNMSDGMCSSWSALMIAKMVDTNSTTSGVGSMTLEQASIIGTLPIYASCLPFALIIYSAGKIGRKWTIIWSSLFMFTSWICLYVASDNINLIYTGAFLRGIAGQSIYSVTLIYMAEISQANIRGFLGSFVPILMNIGMLSTYICIPFMPLRDVALVGLIVNAIFFPLFIFAPRSPYYLIMKNEPDLAKQSLQLLRGTAKVDKELDDIQTTVERDSEEKSSFMDLIKDRPNRNIFIIVILIQVFQQFSGIDAILMFLQVILGSSEQYFTSDVSSILFTCVKLFSCTLALTLMDKLGRRPLLIFSSGSTAVILAILGLYFYMKDILQKDVSSFAWLPVMLLLVYILCYNVGLGSVVFVIGIEMLPTRFRALGSAAIQLSFAVSLIAVTQVFALLKDNYGFHLAFWFLSLSSIAGLIFMFFHISETKGKSLKQIQDEIK